MKRSEWRINFLKDGLVHIYAFRGTNKELVDVLTEKFLDLEVLEIKAYS